MQPLVSIIMPAYNSSQFIREAVNSIQAQRYKSWEAIIVDDFSTDNTYSILEEMAHRDSRIKVLRTTKNSGPATARNLAIADAEGRFIAFLDSDDLWVPSKLEKQIAFMKQEGAALSFTAYEKIDESETIIGRVVSAPDNIEYRSLLNANIIGCLTAIYDTEITGKVFMPEISKRQDYGLWLKILKMGHIAYGLNQPLAYLRKRKGSVSSNKLTAALYVWKVYREVEKLSVLRSSYHFVNYACRAFIKSII
jgi:glycosyltransferase involved in cell wall biosynthesis